MLSKSDPKPPAPLQPPLPGPKHASHPKTSSHSSSKTSSRSIQRLPLMSNPSAVDHETLWQKTVRELGIWVKYILFTTHSSRS